MKTTYSVTQAQSNLPKIVREAAEGGPMVAITVRNETQAFLVSRERMEALVETMEILANPKAIEAIRKAEAGETKYYPIEALDDDWDSDEEPVERTV